MTKVIVTYFNWKNQPIDLDKLRAFLPSLIQEKIDNYVHLEDKIRTTAGYSILKKMLETYFNASSEDFFKIYFHEKGKPHLINNLFCSLSHSGEYVVVAIAKQEIGIDIEKHRSISNEVLEKYFTENEMSILGKQVNTSFFNGWVIKEAASKYLGDGMSAISKIKIQNQTDILFEKEELYYTLFNPIDGYSLCLVSKNVVETSISELDKIS